MKKTGVGKLIGIFLLLLWSGSLMAMGSRTATQAGEGVLDVNSVAADPGAYQGDIIVRGVVAEVASAEASFVLIDVREYQACGVVTCATKFIPVHFSGPLPQIKDQVVVIGEMASSAKGYVLEGKELRKEEAE